MTGLRTELYSKKRRLPLVDREPSEDYFPDTGCEVSPSCLRCPLAKCIYDEPEEERRQAQEERDKEIYRLYLERGAGHPRAGGALWREPSHSAPCGGPHARAESAIGITGESP